MSSILPRVTLDAHPVVCVLDPPIIDPDLRPQEPAVKLADHVVQLLAGVCHLINHSKTMVNNIVTETLHNASHTFSQNFAMLSMCDQACHYGCPHWPCRAPACPTGPWPPPPMRWPWPWGSTRPRGPSHEHSSSSGPSLGWCQMMGVSNSYLLSAHLTLFPTWSRFRHWRQLRFCPLCLSLMCQVDSCCFFFCSIFGKNGTDCCSNFCEYSRELSTNDHFCSWTMCNHTRKYKERIKQRENSLSNFTSLNLQCN